jgi:hypothetical protein
MKRDFSKELIGIPGSITPDNEGRYPTLGAVTVGALLANFQDEASLPGDEKLRRYKLAERISQGGLQEVSAEEVALIKKLIAKAHAIAIVGPAYEALEQDPTARAVS